MAKPLASHVLLTVKATLADASGGQKPQKVRPQVTPHHFWIADGIEMAVADIESVQLVDPQTVGVRRIGRGKELLLRCGSPHDARQLKACLVFHARETRGVTTGAQQWTHLVNPRFDKLDVSDSAVPIVAPKPEALAGGDRVAPGRRWGPAAVAAVVVVAVVAFYIVVFRGRDADFAAFRTEGDKAYAAGRYAEALDFYLKAQVGMAHDAELCGRIGHAHMQLGRHAEAIASLVKAVSFDAGKTPEYSLMLADAYDKTRQPDRALTVLRSARNSFPDHAAVAFALASALNRRGDAQAALRLSEEVRRLQPDNVENQRLYASLLEKSRRYDRAADIYLAMARSAPTYDLYVKAMQAAAKSGDMARCEAILREARRALPGHAQLASSDTDILVGLGLVRPAATPQPEPEPEPATEPAESVQTESPSQPQAEPEGRSASHEQSEASSATHVQPEADVPTGGTTRTALPPPPEAQPVSPSQESPSESRPAADREPESSPELPSQPEPVRPVAPESSETAAPDDESPRTEPSAP